MKEEFVTGNLDDASQYMYLWIPDSLCKSQMLLTKGVPNTQQL